MPTDEIRGGIVYVSYDEAQKMTTLLRAMLGQSDNKRTKEALRKLIQKLSMVRGDVSYAPLHGYQMILTKNESVLFEECRDALGI